MNLTISRFKFGLNSPDGSVDIANLFLELPGLQL